MLRHQGEKGFAQFGLPVLGVQELLVEPGKVQVEVRILREEVRENLGKDWAERPWAEAAVGEDESRGRVFPQDPFQRLVILPGSTFGGIDRPDRPVEKDWHPILRRELIDDSQDRVITGNPASVTVDEELADSLELPGRELILDVIDRILPVGFESAKESDEPVGVLHDRLEHMPVRFLPDQAGKGHRVDPVSFHDLDKAGNVLLSPKDVGVEIHEPELGKKRA